MVDARWQDCLSPQPLSPRWHFWLPPTGSALTKHLPCTRNVLPPSPALGSTKSIPSSQLKCPCLKDGHTEMNERQFLFLWSSQLSGGKGHKRKYGPHSLVSAVVEAPCVDGGVDGDVAEAMGTNEGYSGWCLKSKEKGPPNRTQPWFFISPKKLQGVILVNLDFSPDLEKRG